MSITNNSFSNIARALATGLSLLLISISQTSLAGTVKGEITFHKKASFAGVVYMQTETQTDGTGIIGEIDQLAKAFTKKIVVSGKDSLLRFQNSDSIDHNIFANDASTDVKFDVGLMSPAAEKTINASWSEDTLVRIGCKIHPKMKAYIFTTPTPYYQVLEFEKGKNTYQFSLENVPDDVTKLALKIPKYEEVIVDIAPGGSATVDVKRKGKVKATLTVSR